jgi:predicted alpha/beta-hydrolase family hydrolase
MTDHAAIVPTGQGPVGAIVSEPEGHPREALILLGGPGGPCRAGVNGNWARLARAFAERGIAVLRFDLAAEGDSIVAGADLSREPGWHQNANLAILRELAPWFSERTGVSEPMLAGTCHGARVALEFAAENPNVKSSFLIVPYLWSVPPSMRPEKQVLRRKSLPRASELFDQGSADVGAQEAAGEEVEALNDTHPLGDEVVESCRVALRGGPIWMLIGEGDSQKPVELQRRLGADGERLEVEVVPGMVIHPITHPEVQEVVASRLVDRVLQAAGFSVSGPSARTVT